MELTREERRLIAANVLGDATAGSLVQAALGEYDVALAAVGRGVLAMMPHGDGYRLALTAAAAAAYNADLAPAPGVDPNIDEFQEWCWARAGEHATNGSRPEYLPACVMEEAAEAFSVMKRHVYHHQPLDRAAYVSELGDTLWGLVMAARAVGATVSEVMQSQIAKQTARYPEGFTPAAAAARADERPAVRTHVFVEALAGKSGRCLECGAARSDVIHG